MRRAERGICQILVAAVVAFSVVNGLVWLWIDRRPPKWDEAYYLTLSLKYYESLTSGGIAAFPRSLLTVDNLKMPDATARYVSELRRMGHARMIEGSSSIRVICRCLVLVPGVWQDGGA